MTPPTIQPIGIIKTMPMDFFTRYGMERFEKHFYTNPNEQTDRYFMFTLSGRPKYSVLYFYLLFDGAIRYRANIIQVRGEATYRFPGGTIHGKAWIDTGGPVIKYYKPYPMKGFQGFRYTDGAFEEQTTIERYRP
jgi:hypothetical protein